MIGAALSVALAVTAGQAPLAPSGPWNVHYGDTGCLLARPFGTGDDKIVIGWLSVPLSKTVRLRIQDISNNTAVQRISLNLSMNGVSRDEFALSYSTGKNQHMVEALVEMSIFLDLPDGAEFKLSPSNGTPRTVALKGASKAFEALNSCNTHFLKKIGIDPAEAAKVVTPAKPDEPWIDEYDYPIAAVEAGLMGITSIFYTIELDGRASDCRTIVSSGTPQLDESACDAMRKRGRFKAALDADGKPVRDYASQTISWRLDWPGDAAYERLVKRKAREARAKRDE